MASIMKTSAEVRPRCARAAIASAMLDSIVVVADGSSLEMCCWAAESSDGCMCPSMLSSPDVEMDTLRCPRAATADLDLFPIEKPREYRSSYALAVLER
jgi:hypothetical protein